MSGIEARIRYRRNHEAYLYVIEFSSGTVKVGQTNNVPKRMEQHAKTARMHGVKVTRWWTSEAHLGYRANELELIKFCSARWEIASGREYFTAGDYDQIRDFATTLSFQKLTDAEVDARIADLADDGRNHLIDFARRIGFAPLDAQRLIEAAEDWSYELLDNAWHERFLAARAWFEEHYEFGTYGVAHVGRRAWRGLSPQQRAQALDGFFTHYWRGLRDEEAEACEWVESGERDAELWALSYPELPFSVADRALMDDATLETP